MDFRLQTFFTTYITVILLNFVLNHEFIVDSKILPVYGVIVLRIIYQFYQDDHQFDYVIALV